MTLETSISTTGSTQTWEIAPQSTWGGVILAVLFIYLFIRHFIFVLMVSDIILGWLRQFRWFPGVGKRRKACLHWVGALVLFAGYLVLGSRFGWLNFNPT